MELRPEDQATWETLQAEMPGAAVATITTLLAALWPGQHFVFDRRVFAAANALRIAGGLIATIGMDPSSGGPIPERTLDDYAQVRTWVLESCSELGTPVVSVERALYQLAKNVQGDRGRTWKDYAILVSGQLPGH
jgi:hypothetical protein